MLPRGHVSSVRVSLANGTKRTPSQNRQWGNLLSELPVPHKQCLTGISGAFSASFTSTDLAIFPAVSLYPQQSVPTLRYTRRHLPSAVPWIYVVACILDVINSVYTSLRHCHLSFLRQDRTFSSVYEKTTNRRCTFLAKWHLLVVWKCCYW